MAGLTRATEYVRVGNVRTADQPLYLQIRDRIVQAVLDGGGLGAPLASVRALAAELGVNPLTVAKAYQELQAAGFVESRKGVGLFAVVGARDDLLRSERRRVLEQDWPRFRARLDRLGLDLSALSEPA